MDLITILYGGAKGVLFMVMLFGAYLAYAQMQKGKMKRLFVGYLLFWSFLLFADIYSMIGSDMLKSSGQMISPLLALFSVISSQIVLLWFFYNMIFTLKRSAKIIAVHLAIVAAVLALVWGGNDARVAQYFNLSESLEVAYRGISVGSMCYKALIIVMQLAFTFVVLYLSRKIVPVYQSYIDKNESNAAYNLLWIKEISRILVLITIAYTLLMIFITYINAIIYYVVLTVLYMRMISILIQHVEIESFDELYDKLGVTWNWRKLAFVEDTSMHGGNSDISTFKDILEWINRERPYVNPQFSFSEISAKFDGISYNDFDELIRVAKGLHFQSYIRECRINYAVELMESGNAQLLLKQIAFKVGFDSSPAFSRAFKAVKGVSASEWRISR